MGTRGIGGAGFSVCFASVHETLIPLPPPLPTRRAAARATSRLLLAVSSALLAAACQPELPVAGAPETGLEWVQASSRVHDPTGRWVTFAAEVDVASFLEDGRFGWLEELYVDRLADTFRRQIIQRDALLVQTAGPGGCAARWSATEEASPAELQSYGFVGEPCDAILPRRELHEFLLGLPMSALTPRTRFGESPQATQRNGRDVTLVTLNFEDDPNGQTWFLYVDAATYELDAAAFQFTSGQGEVFELGDFQDYDGFRLAGRRRVLDITGTDFVIEQRVRLEALGE